MKWGRKSYLKFIILFPVKLSFRNSTTPSIQLPRKMPTTNLPSFLTYTHHHQKEEEEKEKKEEEEEKGERKKEKEGGG